MNQYSVLERLNSLTYYELKAEKVAYSPGPGTNSLYLSSGPFLSAVPKVFVLVLRIFSIFSGLYKESLLKMS